MKHFAACLVAGLIHPALAGETPADSGSPPLVPQHQGYDFDHPGILLRQQLFGLAHGASLLATACLGETMQAPAALEAYSAWRLRQRPALETIVNELAAYYFGPRAGEATWEDISRALQLAPDLKSALAETPLEDACRTLPTALVRERFEFERLLREPESAVSPAPTPATPDNGKPQ